MNSRERDESTDRLLRRGLARTPDAQTTSSCVDAETLAAWMDGSLPRDAVARAEAHASTCGRCQSLLASMARTAPATEVRPWWRAQTLRWMVPITAAATALAVWVAVDLHRADVVSPAPPLSATTTAPANPPESANNAPQAPIVAPSPKAAREGASSRPAAKPSARDERASKLTEMPADARTADSIDVTTMRTRQGLGRSGGEAGRPGFTSTPPPASPPVVAPDAAGAPSPAAPSPPVTVNESVTIAETGALDRSAKNASQGLMTRTVDIPSPERAFRWRVVGSASVERSTDGGTTWTAQSIAPAPAAPQFAARQAVAASVVLTAGSAPARDICWIVGQAGAVFLSTNGTTWEHKPFPEPVKLTAVRASDARTAVVTTEDGRQFSTSDGGATWSKIP